jgi:hypothetical protein
MTTLTAGTHNFATFAWPATLPNVQRDLVAELDRLEIALGVVELLAPIPRTAVAISSVVADARAYLRDASRPGAL